MPTTATPASEKIDEKMLADRAQSVGHLFRSRVQKTPNRVAYWYPTGDDYAKVTWAEVQDRVYPMAAGLISLGVQSEDRVALASGTRYEWALADLANMCAGTTTTTIYPTTIADDVAFILADSGSVAAFAEDATQVEKLRSIRDTIPDVRKVIVFDGEGDGDWVMSLAELEDAGRALLAEEPGAVDARIDAIESDHLATIIYTSGTTGRPKGVRLLHKTWTYQGAATGAIKILQEDDLQYLWLPLAHVFGKQLLTIPLQVGFPTVIDGRIDKIVENLPKVKPTFMAAVPRIFEKVHGNVSLMMQKEGGAKLKLFNWATGVGAKISDLEIAGQKPGVALAAQHRLADKLVLSTVRNRFGGNIRFFISGSAALNYEIAKWFHSVGLPVAEGYGLTETSSAAYVNRLENFKIGSVGWPLPGLETRIAEDGEILLRGEGIMAGYHNNPEATAEVLDDDGWFHTGDIGELDANGYLKITDRKKDLFKTSNGKYVAPSQLEASFKALCPYVSQILVHGNNRNFVSALVTLDAEAIKPWAAANGMDGKSYEEIVTSAQAHDMVQGYIEQLNGGLNRWEQVKKFSILGSDFTVDGGELTPSLKMKRKVVQDKFAKDLDAFYA
ncbi:MAG: long-chain fatty acid--CoA ligase [Tetrasphaera jenkinsii]|jgi:long-chain acyl-CoA synthetase|nr:long-chain fatty acid--CoA ligase [Tetrasphaera jenkinsii]